ncbi:MAG: hypothetical protein ACLQBB_06415 [Solirubrobacteraceae bacterium]
MDGSKARIVAEGELLLTGRRDARAARHLAVEREKAELRRERDRMMLDLARELGSAGLAERLGIAPSAMLRLLQEARERLGAPAAQGASPTQEISVRRMPVADIRWAHADAHYEALGRTAE